MKFHRDSVRIFWYCLELIIAVPWGFLLLTFLPVLDLWDMKPGASAEIRGQFDAAELQLSGVSAGNRLQRRTQLLQGLQAVSAGSEAGPDAAHLGWQQQHDTAVSLLAGGQLGAAVDLERERPEVLSRYGGTVFGRSLLAARRLVEAGVWFNGSSGWSGARQSGVSGGSDGDFAGASGGVC